MTQKHTPPDRIWVDNYSKKEKGPNRTSEPVWAADKYLLSTPAREAADELLEALEMAQLWLDFDGRFDMQKINAAIAKVKGETQ